ncbi:MBL fold metallo-hydrolase [Actinomadura sp. KC216]|uniref:MBL fold metallo-hydrolase n=1 Tax=Actinomadura sp. KC216 TaxID=2530370 RepID=UPI00104AA4D9|nr:MBL fold metallo-hydrolase [Actinomadura sp. KC216]TDB87477.1 MBL fold metallo-hydrolase [Actinomadura sp. KC216]
MSDDVPDPLDRVQWEAWSRKLLPPVQGLGGGLWSIPVPLPLEALRYVLVYALELDDGVALVDAGWDTEEAWRALTGGLAAAGFGIGDVRAVLVTHIHPDHYGLAHRIREESGAWVGLHPADAALLAVRYDDVDSLIEDNRVLLERIGTPEEQARELASASMAMRRFVSVAKPDRLIEDGQRLGLPGWNLRAVWTPGHSPGHLCFADEDRRMLFSGDHVLPRITPNISMHPQQRSNPLQDFIDSLRKVGALDVHEVLPAHEYRFAGLSGRVAHLLAHHEERLDEIEKALRERPGAGCWEISSRLTWSRPWSSFDTHSKRAATGETLAHMVLLEQRGRLVRSGGRPERWWPPALLETDEGT